MFPKCVNIHVGSKGQGHEQRSKAWNADQPDIRRGGLKKEGGRHEVSDENGESLDHRRKVSKTWAFPLHTMGARVRAFMKRQ